MDTVQVIRDIIYSLTYNGIALYLFLATGLFIFFCLSGLKRALGWHRMICVGIISSLLITNAVIKMVFSKFVHIDTFLPWWFSPIIDLILVSFIIWMSIIIWRVLRRCR